jgi:hypothetical protein
VAYYFYWQNNQKVNIQPKSNQELQELKTQVNYYKQLYQKRVQKDLGLNQETQTDLTQEQMLLFSEISQGVLT